MSRLWEREQEQEQEQKFTFALFSASVRLYAAGKTATVQSAVDLAYDIFCEVEERKVRAEKKEKLRDSWNPVRRK